MSMVLPGYRMKFERVIDGEQAVDRDPLGLRSKLGGAPDWIQGDETPSCFRCRARMSFVGQIDSIEHDEGRNPHAVDCRSGEQKFMFGDVGMIYLFFCLDCLESRSVFQCY